MWTSIFAILLQVVSYVFKYIDASNATRDAFLKFVEGAKDDGLISIQAHDKFQELHKKIESQK